MTEELWVDGRPAAILTGYGWGELTWSHAADGGCKEASWKMDFPVNFSHPSFVRNKAVDIKVGPFPIWSGILTEPDFDDDWTFTAVGRSTLADNGFLALDGSGNVTFTPDTAIDRAITKGIGWLRPTSISAATFKPTSTTDDLLYLGALLDQWADSAGKRWGVDAQRQVYAAADPATPQWYLVPGSGRFGLADDEYASDIVLRYLASGGSYATTTVTDQAASDQFGPREYGVDATGLGTKTALAIQAVGAGLMAKGKARQGFTNGLEVTPYQLLTPGGRPAPLHLVKGQQLVRQFGVLDERGQPHPYMDWVIGETSLEAGSSTIGLDPVGLVARDLTSALSLSQEAS